MTSQSLRDKISEKWTYLTNRRFAEDMKALQKKRAIGYEVDEFGRKCWYITDEQNAKQIETKPARKKVPKRLHFYVIFDGAFIITLMLLGLRTVLQPDWTVSSGLLNVSFYLFGMLFGGRELANDVCHLIDYESCLSSA